MWTTIQTNSRTKYFIGCYSPCTMCTEWLTAELGFDHWHELPQTFVVTKDVFCHDRHVFVVTKDVFCHDRHVFVVTKDVFCHDRHVFVVTTVILVAATTSDRLL